MSTHWVRGEGDGVGKCEESGRVGDPNNWRKMFLLGESGTVAPTVHKGCVCPLTSLPRRRRHAPHKAFTKAVKFGECAPPHLTGPGFWITKCYPSVVCSILRHFAVVLKVHCPCTAGHVLVDTFFLLKKVEGNGRRLAGN